MELWYSLQCSHHPVTGPSGHSNAVYLHMQYGVHRTVFYLHKSVNWRLASGPLLPQPSPKFRNA